MTRIITLTAEQASKLYGRPEPATTTTLPSKSGVSAFVPLVSAERTGETKQEPNRRGGRKAGESFLGQQLREAERKAKTAERVRRHRERVRQALMDRTREILQKTPEVQPTFTLDGTLTGKKAFSLSKDQAVGLAEASLPYTETFVAGGRERVAANGNVSVSRDHWNKTYHVDIVESGKVVDTVKVGSRTVADIVASLSTRFAPFSRPQGKAPKLPTSSQVLRKLRDERVYRGMAGINRLRSKQDVHGNWIAGSAVKGSPSDTAYDPMFSPGLPTSHPVLKSAGTHLTTERAVLVKAGKPVKDVDGKPLVRWTVYGTEVRQDGKVHGNVREAGNVLPHTPRFEPSPLEVKTLTERLESKEAKSTAGTTMEEYRVSKDEPKGSRRRWVRLSADVHTVRKCTVYWRPEVTSEVLETSEGFLYSPLRYVPSRPLRIEAETKPSVVPFPVNDRAIWYTWKPGAEPSECSPMFTGPFSHSGEAGTYRAYRPKPLVMRA